jgi:hypothetical protein
MSRESADGARFIIRVNILRLSTLNHFFVISLTFRQKTLPVILTPFTVLPHGSPLFFKILSFIIPNPDKRDKYLYEIIFCQKRAENYFLGTNKPEYYRLAQRLLHVIERCGELDHENGHNPHAFNPFIHYKRL